MAKKVVVELTVAEAHALSQMAGQSAYSDEDMYGTLHSRISVRVGYRAYEKLKAAIAAASRRKASE